MRVLALEGVIGRCSTQYYEVIVSPSCALSLFKYTINMWSWWPWTNRKYVCIAACALELAGVIDVWCY